MTVPPFELHRPATVEGALKLRAELGEDGVWYAGGTALLLLMKMGLAQPPHLIDVKRIEGLSQLTADGGVLTVGAAATYQDILESSQVRAGWPALASVAGDVGNIRVRSAGTLCGNLAFANPRSDPAVFLLACGATVSLRSSQDRRDEALETFIVASFTTDIRAGELITGVRLPSWDAAAYVRFKPLDQEYPVIGIAVAGRVREGAFLGPPRIAIGAAGNPPKLCKGAAGELAGAQLADLAATGRAAQAAATEAAPVSDGVASAEYKAHMIRSLLPSAIKKAAAAIQTPGLS